MELHKTCNVNSDIFEHNSRTFSSKILSMVEITNGAQPLTESDEVESYNDLMTSTCRPAP